MREQVSVDDELSVEELVQRIDATIIDMDVALKDHGDPKRFAGTVESYLVKLGTAINNGLDALDACDSVTQDVYEYGAAVLDPDGGQLKQELAEEFECFSGDLLILHCAKILPGHRGRDLGLLAARRIIELFGNGLVVCRPQPLQHVGKPGDRGVSPDESNLEYRLFTKSTSDGKKALQAYWRKLGFRRIGRSDFYALSTTMQLPAVKSRGKKRRTRA